MRNAALVLGIIAGLMFLVIGVASYGWTELVQARPEAEQVLGNFINPALVRFVSVAAPVLALAGGAMAKVRALWGGIALLVSAGLMVVALGFNFWTMFPVVMAVTGGLLALSAGRPDEPKAHF